MEFISLSIVAISVWAAFSRKVHTNTWLLHMLWAAAAFSACGVIGSAYGMVIGLLFSITSAIYWMYQEISCLLKHHKIEE